MSLSSDDEFSVLLLATIYDPRKEIGISNVATDQKEGTWIMSYSTIQCLQSVNASRQ